jgi:hypothetical protein
MPTTPPPPPLLRTDCRSCAREFFQAADPGKRKEYCSAACRQRAYRARGGRASGTRRESASARARREEQEAYAREEARREQERQRSQRRRGHQQDTSHRPDWCQPEYGIFTDTKDQAKARARCGLLFDRALHPQTGAEAADACIKAAQRIARRHNLT